MNRSPLLAACLVALAALGTTHPASANTQIYRLKRGDGAVPQDRLVPDGTGGFYGTTTARNEHGIGLNGQGTLFHLTPPAAPRTSWSYTVLHRFSNADGRFPLDLVLGTDGSLYGTTQRGGLTDAGKNAKGTVFRLSPPPMGQQDWTFSVLKAFRNQEDGDLPAGSLLGDKNGSLYGITVIGGKYGYGTAYRLSTTDNGKTWVFSPIHQFAPNEGHYLARNTGLVGDPAAALYGVDFASGGHCHKHGDIGCGEIYELQPGAEPSDPWSYTLIYQFQNDADGNTPIGPLAQGADGALYGVTLTGGPANAGEVFSLTPPSPGARDRVHWTKTLLYAFPGGTGGEGPASGLAIDQDGTIYGNTYTGGTSGGPCESGCGTVFRLSPPSGGGAWIFSLLHSFGVPPDGAFPMNDQPTIFSNYVFGLTYGGGTGCQIQGGDPTDCYGTIYRVRK